jgi:hypothetical protein
VRIYPRVRPLDRLRSPGSSDSSSAATPDVDLIADSWGPVWQVATKLGLSAAGPLMLPGNWIFE